METLHKCRLESDGLHFQDVGRHLLLAVGVMTQCADGFYGRHVLPGDGGVATQEGWTRPKWKDAIWPVDDPREDIEHQAQNKYEENDWRWPIVDGNATAAVEGAGRKTIAC